MYMVVLCHDVSLKVEFHLLWLCAVWYLIEVVAQEYMDMDSTFVVCCYFP
jgi:hypothetical protein